MRASARLASRNPALGKGEGSQHAQELPSDQPRPQGPRGSPRAAGTFSLTRSSAWQWTPAVPRVTVPGSLVMPVYPTDLQDTVGTRRANAKWTSPLPVPWEGCLLNPRWPRNIWGEKERRWQKKPFRSPAIRASAQRAADCGLQFTTYLTVNQPTPNLPPPTRTQPCSPPGTRGSPISSVKGLGLIHDIPCPKGSEKSLF